MKISGKTDAAQRGLTLLELIIVLMVMSLMTTIVGAGFRARSSKVAVERVADQLFIDLKHARLEAETRGMPLQLIGNDAAYNIAGIDVNRRLGQGVVARWNGSADGKFLLGAGLRQEDVVIALQKGPDTAVIRIASFSGRISRD